TATFLGGRDAGEVKLLGRVTAIWRRPAMLPLPRIARPLVWALHWLAVRWTAGDPARSIIRRLRSIRSSRLLLPVRRRIIGAVEIRVVKFKDLEALLSFAGQHLAIPREFLKHQLLKRWYRTGVAVGDFTGVGRMCGFAYLDEYRQEGLEVDGFWVRSLMVAPMARRMRIGRRLVELLCSEAANRSIPVARADIDVRNKGSLDLFRGLGFQPAALQI